MTSTNDIRPQWKNLAEMWSAPKAEHAFVPGYELTAFVLPPDLATGEDGEIGWEVHGGPKLDEQVATGQADSFEQAKERAEIAWRSIVRGPSPS